MLITDEMLNENGTLFISGRHKHKEGRTWIFIDVDIYQRYLSLEDTNTDNNDQR